MRKLFLCLVVTATCLLPSPRPTVAAFPCGTYCCTNSSTADTRCGVERRLDDLRRLLGAHARRLPLKSPRG